MLGTLGIIAIADQGDGSKRRKGEGLLLFAEIPGEETFNRASVATNGAFRTITRLEFFKPAR